MHWSLRTPGAALAAAAAIGAVGETARAEVQPSGDPALYWNQVLATGIAGPPAFQTRTYAMVSAAIHEAVNATSGFPDYSYIKGVATSGGDTAAATAVAAHALLVQLNPAKTADYNAARDAVLAAIPDGAAKTDGIATGTAVAAAALAMRAGDGSNAVVPYVPTGDIGHWAPTPPGFAPALGPQWGEQTPWLMTSPDQLRPGPPPAVGSIAYVLAYNEVMDIGSAASATRTADQTAAATFWAGTAGQQWNQVGLDIAETSGMSTIENARLFALLNVSVADAVIGVWDSKYHYDFWRPITAIRTDDGDPATATDPLWNSFLTNPPYPDYISGLSGIVGAGATILTALLGDQSFCMTGSAGTRCFNSFGEAAFEGPESRLWGGIHFRFANEQGLLLGQNAANYALSTTAFDAVPEPATWALMIGGFGLAGLALRRRRARLVA